MGLSSRLATRPLSYQDKLTFWWFILDGITHLTIELAYVLLALGPTAMKAEGLMAMIWREYGKADARWAVRDANIISLELVTAFLLGPLCLVLAYAVWYRKPYRHALQIVVSTCEIYGGWMTFMPDILEGSKNLDLEDPIYLWIYLVFMNGVWVWIPLILLWESFAKISQACDVSKAEGRDDSPVSRIWWHSFTLTLVMYAILVPVVIYYKVIPEN